MTETPYTFDIRIRCEDFPGARFGDHAQIRVGIRREREVIQDVPGDAESAIFTATIQAKRGAKDGRPRFSGPFVFGPATAPFLYLSWGERKEGRWEMFRRAKIPLGGLEWDRILKAIDEDRPIEVTIGLTNANGEPVCATFIETVDWGGSGR